MKRPPTMFVSIPRHPEERILEFIESMERKKETPRYADADGVAELDEYIEQARKNLRSERELRTKIAAKQGG
jgi:hypothetical protein